MAAIRGEYNHFNYRNEFIRNIFYFSSELVTSPLLKLRVLKFLSEAHYSNPDPVNSYVLLDTVEAYFKPLGVSSPTIAQIIHELYNDGLIDRFNPSEGKELALRRFAITECGIEHLELGSRNGYYIAQMAIRTPLRTQGTVHQIQDHFNESHKYGMLWAWTNILATYAKYCIDEDAVFICPLPNHKNYLGQEILLKDFKTNTLGHATSVESVEVHGNSELLALEETPQ